MIENPKFTFLCGVVMPGSTGLLSLGIIRLKNLDAHGNFVQIQVSSNDPGITKISPGKKRMVIVKNGVIIALFVRPRIKLLQMLERGEDICQDLISSYHPAYPRSEFDEASLRLRLNEY